LDNIFAAMQCFTELALLLLFTVIGFFFAMAETALLTLGKWRLRQISIQNPARGAFVRKLLSSPQDLLATIALGNTMAHGAIIATVLVISLKIDQQYYVILAISLAAVLFLFCEVVPKTLAMRKPETWAPLVAFYMLWMVRITRPVRVVAQGINNKLMWMIPKNIEPLTSVTDDEYSELVELGWLSGTLGISEKEIILQIMQLDRRSVAELMKPRSLMASIPHDLPAKEILLAIRKYQHRRLPMFDGSPDNIVGILNTARLLKNPDIDMMEVIDFPSYVPEEMNLLELLKSFQRQRHGMAIVLDEFGTTVGLVTLEDILSDVVGRLRRKGRSEKFRMERDDSGKWCLSGNVWLEDFRREYPQLKRTPGVDTIGGLVASKSDLIPPVGTEINFSGLNLKVTQADGRRVLEVVAQKLGKMR
jgi:CBS domain containing-hemolysin-like protein